MARFKHVGILFVIFILFLTGISTAYNVDEERRDYIVYMGSHPQTLDYSPSNHHLNMLSETVDSRFVGKSLIRSYKRSFNGFAASLTNQEMQKLNARDDVLLVIPSQTYHLHTTSSWDFMGFNQNNVSRNPNLESDVIIGVIDSGIWPESESFNDRGLGPIPKKWKGECQGGQNFTCNKKLIGARNYVLGESTARDAEGHGTHTASTAAGSPVGNVSFYGLARGTARGGVPSARVAAYRVCSSEAKCEDHAILAAFDDAIADGVDIISLSLGSSSASKIQDDVIAIGAFAAVKKGILTVHSAGNSYNPGTVGSTAPWLLTVGASTMTRNFVSKVLLGNGKKLNGTAVNVFKMNGTEFPLVRAEDASFPSRAMEARLCESGSLDKLKVKGKIVLCATTDSEGAITEVKRAGGIGVIGLDDFGSWPFVTPHPHVPLEQELFQQVEEYIKSTKFPKANFLKAETVEDDTAPAVASFSSRGPNAIYPGILKPDITAPGVDILAAYPPGISPSGFPTLDGRSVNYNLLSGTSMACPHVAGVAAYVKSLHPKWSPSAIKSAIMTTALEMDSTKPGNREAEFAYGSGHLNPRKAANPGLVYESLDNDYIRVICGLNTTQIVTKIFGTNVPCQRINHLKTKDLNYPTMSAKVPNGGSFNVIFPRTVTNVGYQNSTYQAKISGTSNLNITVQPSILSFKALLEKKTFSVTVAGVLQQDIQQVVSASLQWSDGVHSVRSPIVIYTDLLL